MGIRLPEALVALDGAARLIAIRDCGVTPEDLRESDRDEAT